MKKCQFNIKNYQFNIVDLKGTENPTFVRKNKGFFGCIPQKV